MSAVNNPMAPQLPGAEDRALIQDTIARYNRGIDTGDRNEYLSIFTSDAIKENLSVWGTLKGRDQIGKAFDDYFSAPKFEKFRGGQHRVSSQIFDKVEPDRVESWCSYIFVVPSADGPRIATMGTYRDIFVRQGGRWLIAQRHILRSVAPMTKPTRAA